MTIIRKLKKRLSSHDVDKRLNPLSPPKEAKIINDVQVKAIKDDKTNDEWQEDAIAISTNRIITRDKATDNEYQADEGWFCEFCEKEVDDLEDHVKSRHQSKFFNEEAEDSWFWHCDL